MKKVFICLGLMVLCIVAAILLRKPADNADPDYTEVQVKVVSSEKKTTNIKVGNSRTQTTEYEVIVSYEGKDYKLQNAHDAYSYSEGGYTTAYLYHGKLYANLEGVKNATPFGIAYSAAVFGAFGMFIVSMLLLAKAGGKKGEKLL